MIKLIEKQKIIIAYHNQKKSQRTIARDLGLNRRTVAKYIVIGKFFQKIYNRYYRIVTVPRFSLGFLNSWRPYLGQFRK